MDWKLPIELGDMYSLFLFFLQLAVSRLGNRVENGGEVHTSGLGFHIDRIVAEADIQRYTFRTVLDLHVGVDLESTSSTWKPFRCKFTKLTSLYKRMFVERLELVWGR